MEIDEQLEIQIDNDNQNNNSIILEDYRNLDEEEIYVTKCKEVR